MKIMYHKILKNTFLLSALILTLSPFLYLTKFNHPSSDDYCYSSKTSFLGFLATQADHWHTWSGRYTATALLSLLTLENITLFGYRIIPIILFLLFGAALYVFLRSLFPKAASYDICALAFIILFLYIFKAPNITEAFYWLAGSVTYQLASILSLFLFAVILHLPRQIRKSRKKLLVIIGSLLGILVVGLNEVSLIYLCIVLFLWLGIRFYINRKPEWGFIIIVSSTFLAAGISLTAPGNYMRMSTIKVEQFNFTFSFSESVYLALDAVKSWLPLIVLLIIIFFNSFIRIATEVQKSYNLRSISWKYIVQLIILLFGVLVLGYFPTFWSQGWEPPTRTVNVILLAFIIGSIGIVILSLISIKRSSKTVLKVPFYVKFSAILIIITYITFLTNNIKTAYYDIYLEKAVIYDVEMEERYKLLSNCEVGLCDIPLRLSVYPPTIFAYELGLKKSDEIYYYNKCLVDYIHNTYTPPERKLRE